MNQEMKADFCIEIDFEKGSENPSRIFKAMTELIESFEKFDADLVKSIDAKIQPVVIIEDIEAGSIKSWLSNSLKAVDDEALKNIDWKPAIGKYIVKAKHLVINFIDKKTQISSKEEIEQLENNLLKLAKDTDVKRFPAYSPIKTQNLLPHIKNITDSLSNLNEQDQAFYKSADGDSRFNAEFSIVPEQIEDLLTRETITQQKCEMILKVKKPDYLGESRWEFRHGKQPIHAKILHKEWLADFQERKYDVRPGDSLRALVDILANYGYDNELVSTRYNIVEVLEIISGENGEQLILPEHEKD
ncbi:hypothetical protein ACFL6I_04095 [candidate division KSB1 bacterium]